MTLALLLFLLPPPACQPIHSTVIRGSDLAAAAPVFADIPPAVEIGLAPLPGQHRRFTISELKRIAALNHLPIEPQTEACFAWTLAPLDSAKIVAAMQTTLSGRNPRIEVLEQSLAPVPEGELAFPLANWNGSSEGGALWRGYVRYANGRQFPVWARVTVTVSESRVVAGAELHPGDLIEARQLKTENYSGPLTRDKFIPDIPSAAGMLVRRPVAAGAAILSDMLETPREVERGDLVNAIVQNGAARLDVQAVAQDGGRHGQIITVKNPRSGRTFRARIEDKDVVVVVPGGSVGLVGSDSTKS